jgi:hypothetical protein
MSLTPPLTVRGFTAPGNPECLACGAIHPVWPSADMYPPIGEMGSNPYTPGLVLRVLAAAGDGSPECNTTLLLAPVQAYRAVLKRDGTSERRRRKDQRNRMRRREPLLHEELFYAFNSLTLWWAMRVGNHTGEPYLGDTILNRVVYPANDLITDVPEDLVMLAGAVFHVAFKSTPPLDDGAMVESLLRESMQLEALAERARPLDVYAGMHDMLLTAASYTIYACALAAQLDS